MLANCSIFVRFVYDAWICVSTAFLYDYVDRGVESVCDCLHHCE